MRFRFQIKHLLWLVAWSALVFALVRHDLELALRACFATYCIAVLVGSVWTAGMVQDAAERWCKARWPERRFPVALASLSSLATLLLVLSLGMGIPAIVFLLLENM